MNDTQIVDQRVEAYVDDVARGLAGLDPEDRAALLDDVREHATAVLAEAPGVELSQRLGSPDSFARELLESAGIPTASARGGSSWSSRYQSAKASRLGQVLGRAATDFAPAWAAMRGVAATWLITRLLNADLDEQLPLLLLAGGVAGWLLSAQYTAVVRRGPADKLLRYAANAMTALVAVMLFWSWAGTFAPGSVDSPYLGPTLTQDGGLVAGIQPFGPDGKPAPVTLFDQNGTPLDTGGRALDNLTCAGDLIVVPVPYRSASGQPITNAYPARGVCVNGANVVVSDAAPETFGAPVQTWSTAGLPKPGQEILIDDNGAYAGVTAAAQTASSSPAPKATPSRAGSTTVAPSAKTR